MKLTDAAGAGQEVVVRASSVELMRVPRNTSHCAPALTANHVVSPSLVRPLGAFAKLTRSGNVKRQVSGPGRAGRFLDRSMTLCAMAITRWWSPSNRPRPGHDDERC